MSRMVVFTGWNVGYRLNCYGLTLPYGFRSIVSRTFCDCIHVLVTATPPYLLLFIYGSVVSVVTRAGVRQFPMG